MLQRSFWRVHDEIEEHAVQPASVTGVCLDVLGQCTTNHDTDLLTALCHRLRPFLAEPTIVISS